MVQVSGIYVNEVACPQWHCRAWMRGRGRSWRRGVDL